MATGAWNLAHEGALPDRLTGTPRAAFLDRWIYVITVSLFILLVLLGFIPDSLAKIAAVNAGERPPFPLIMHVHAVLMGSFLVLLWTQALLMATGRGALHRQLGIASFIVAPAMVVAGFLLAHTMYLYGWHAMLAAPAAMHDELVQRMQGRDNILLVQLRVGILFSAFLLIGLRARRADFGLHKRMMILATAMALPAGIDAPRAQANQQEHREQDPDPQLDQQDIIAPLHPPHQLVMQRGRGSQHRMPAI